MKHLKVGDKAPFFETITQDGKAVSSTSLLGKKWALYFYPKDLTPGCINQACSLRDSFSSLKKAGISIIGVSMDNEKRHHRFIDRYSLPFPLIPDVDKKLIELFGVWGPKKFMGRTFDGIHRITFLMDEEGIIVGIIEKPKTKKHAEEILDLYTEVKNKKILEEM